MSILELVKSRRSVRRYQDKPIAKADLENILEAARLAPSAHNAQEYKIVVVQDGFARERLSEAAGQPFIASAPAILVGVATNPQSKYHAIDLAIAFDHISLTAWSLGIGSCWIGAFGNDEVREAISAPEGCRVVVLMPLGYPADRELPKRRKPLAELVSRDKL